MPRSQGRSMLALAPAVDAMGQSPGAECCIEVPGDCLLPEEHAMMRG